LLDGGVDVTAAVLQRAFALHHARTGAFAKRFNLCCGNCHNPVSLSIRYARQTGTDMQKFQRPEGPGINHPRPFDNGDRPYSFSSGAAAAGAADGAGAGSSVTSTKSSGCAAPERVARPSMIESAMEAEYSRIAR